jgi:hypothetical protein
MLPYIARAIYLIQMAALRPLCIELQLQCAVPVSSVSSAYALYVPTFAPAPSVGVKCFFAAESMLTPLT